MIWVSSELCATNSSWLLSQGCCPEDLIPLDVSFGLKCTELLRAWHLGFQSKCFGGNRPFPRAWVWKPAGPLLTGATAGISHRDHQIQGEGPETPLFTLSEEPQVFHDHPVFYRDILVSQDNYHSIGGSGDQGRVSRVVGVYCWVKTPFYFGIFLLFL